MIDFNVSMLAAFEKLWTELGCEGDPKPIYKKLDSYYNNPGRHYHTLKHISWCLQCAKDIGEAQGMDAKYMLPIYWAIWFHDMCMSFDLDSTATTKDEELSASMAVVIAQHAGLSEDFAAHVHRLIMATAHLKAPTRMDEAILVDADLSILGALRERFDAYEELVRKEWMHVDVETFCHGREKALTCFACMPRIFTTEAAHKKWEEITRSNIARSRSQIRRRLDALTPHLRFEETVKGFFHDGTDHSYEMVLISSDYDKVQRYTTEADLLLALKNLRDKRPDRYASLMAELNAYV